MRLPGEDPRDDRAQSESTLALDGDGHDRRAPLERRVSVAQKGTVVLPVDPLGHFEAPVRNDRAQGDEMLIPEIT